jgi:hypothetical protein
VPLKQIDDLPSQPGHAQAFASRHNWLLRLGGSPRAYLALRPIALATPPIVWDNILVPHRAGADAFALPLNLRLTIPQVLIDRRDSGYKRVSDAAAGLALYHLGTTAQSCWEALANVSEGLIEHIDVSLSNDLDDSSWNLFSDPQAVYQLNRMICEGFIEGHAQLELTTSENYETEAQSKEAWRVVLARARAATATQIDELEPAERDAIRMLELNPLGFSAETIINLLTPGDGLAQEMAFWYMHYPHWHKDLLFALQTLRRQRVRVSDEDFRIIAQIIGDNLPTQNSSLEGWDKLGALVVGATNQLLSGSLTSLNPVVTMISRIFKKIQLETGP